MKVFLLRHGTAELVAPRDEERRLSAEGRRGLKSVFDACEADLSSVEAVLVSPYIRTQQTLNMALPYLPLVAAEQCETLSILTPGGNPNSVIERLYKSEAKSVLLVTHQPLVGVLLDALCACEAGRYRMDTGALALIELDVAARGLGELQWLR